MRTGVQLQFLLLVALLGGVCLVVSCQSTDEEQDENWIEASFHDIAYRVPPSWDAIRDRNSIRYRRKKTQMNSVEMKQIAPGETVPGTDITVEPSRDIWAYADAKFQSLNRDAKTVRAVRKEQRRFSGLGSKSFIMKVRTMNTSGVSRRRWFIGAMIKEHYYDITLHAERFGHLPAVQDAFRKFKASLRLKGSKNEAEPSK